MGGKLKAALLLVVMYGLGVASGIVYQNCRAGHWEHHGRGARRLEKMKSELKLTPAQTQEIESIFTKAHERARQVNEEVAWDLDDIHKDSVQSIRKVLTPEQLSGFEKLHERFHFRRGTPHEDAKH